MIAAQDDGGVIRGTSEMTIAAGGQQFDFEFRSVSKAERAYAIVVQHWAALR